MYDSNSIFARLQNGETVEDIAQEMSDALNAAKELQKEAEEKAKREEEEKAVACAQEEKIKTEKVRIAERIIDSICEYAALIRNDDLLKAARETEPTEVVDLLDEMVVLYKKLDRLKELEFKFPRDKNKNIFDLWDEIFK